MKLSLVTLAAAVAAANAADCPLTQLTPLLTNPNVTACTTDSGFSFTSPAIPTGTALTALCSSSACQSVLAYVTSLGLGDCTLLGVQLETGLLNPLTAACGGNSSGSSSGTSTSSPTVGSTGGTTSNSTSSGSTTTTTTTTPTPSPTSAAATATVGVAASAVVVALAASLF